MTVRLLKQSLPINSRREVDENGNLENDGNLTNLNGLSEARLVDDGVAQTNSCVTLPVAKLPSNPIEQFSEESAPVLPDPLLLKWSAFSDYVRFRCIPWMKRQNQIYWAVETTPKDHAVQLDSAMPRAQSFGFPCFGQLKLRRGQLSHLLQARFVRELNDEALNRLLRRQPHRSARNDLTAIQKYCLPIVLFLLCIAAMFSLTWAYFGTVVFFTILFGSILALRTACFVSIFNLTSHRNESQSKLMDGDYPENLKLPIYSILIPLHKEGNMIPAIATAMDQLDYPHQKLDIKLILEDDDDDTLQAVLNADLDDRFEIIRVPYSLPRTKPKACNFALPFVRGEFVVIYDAEDRPEPDQLLKAIALFNSSSEDIVCLQSRLGFYNGNENWLTRQFAIEYAAWFHLILPGLYALDLPIPLGGTSNHFRTDALRQLDGWDPYNVTEDADLGIRIAANGLRTAILPSTTWEEANCKTGNWLRQRSRWKKGYFQTWLVHSRHPQHLIRDLGLFRFAGFNLIIAGSVLLGLGPVIALSLFCLGSLFSEQLLDYTPFSIVSTLGLPLFVYGYGLILISIFICYSRMRLDLRFFDFVAIPFYWLLICGATVLGIWQFFRNRFYWEKTTHGLSRDRGIDSEPKIARDEILLDDSRVVSSQPRLPALITSAFVMPSKRTLPKKFFRSLLK